jgi:hypothetical protein
LRNGASNAQSAGVRRLVALAYVLAISIPPLGLIFGIALIIRSGKQPSLHGLGVIALSIITLIVWIVVLTSGTLNTSTPGY